MSHQPDFIFSGPATPAIQRVNIGQLLDSKAQAHPEKNALKSRWQDTPSLTYSTLRAAAREVANGLLQIGVRPKDIVVALAGNAIEYAELFLAVGGIGATFAIVNPTFSSEEVVAAVEFLDPKAVVVAERIGFRNNKALIKSLADVRGQRSIIQLGGLETASSGVTQWPNLRVPSEKSKLLDQHWAQAKPTDPLCIQFTSGTTGPRKAAVLTHENLINNAYLIGDRLGFTSSDVLCCCPPLFHCFGLVCGLLAGLSHDCKVVLPSNVFNAEDSLQAMAEEHCTIVHAIPTMFQAMLDYPHASKYSPSFRLRTGIIAGSSLSETLLKRLSDEFRLDGLAYAFDMTELSAVSFLTSPSKVSLLQDRSSVGTLMPHTAAKVVDENLAAQPPGSRGELLVSGYLVSSEYYGNPEKTRDAVVVDAQGRRWLKTGDLVTLDHDGSCRVVGRSKDMIKKGGENIAPADVEKVLEGHPDIATAAVIGVPDKQWGEKVGAFVRRSNASSTGSTSKQVRVWMRNKIAAHKIPDHLFWIGEGDGVPTELPINASGKVLKNELTTAMQRLVGVQPV